jgi:hypothetical protein
MLTSIAAVPASTSRSPQLRVIIYSPNQSSTEPRILGHAARAGQPPPLSRHTTPRVSDTPHSGKPVTSGPVTPYTTSVDVNPARRRRSPFLLLSEYTPDATGTVIPPDEHPARLRHAASVHKPVTSC